MGEKVTLLPILLLAACADLASPRPATEGNPTLTYVYSQGQADDMLATAFRHCASLEGRVPELIDDLRRGAERVASFECVRRRRA